MTHRTEVKRRDERGRAGGTFLPSCTCGWIGQWEHATRRAAEDDAAEHVRIMADDVVTERCTTCHQPHPDMSEGDPEGDPGCDWDTFPGFGLDFPGRLDHHANTVARDGIDRCECGCKYWERDRCIDCGARCDTQVSGVR